MHHRIPNAPAHHLILLLCTNAFASVSIPNAFTAGSPISASLMNQNFSVLSAYLQAAQSCTHTITSSEVVNNSLPQSIVISYSMVGGGGGTGNPYQCGGGGGSSAILITNPYSFVSSAAGGNGNGSSSGQNGTTATGSFTLSPGTSLTVSAGGGGGGGWWGGGGGGAGGCQDRCRL